MPKYQLGERVRYKAYMQRGAMAKMRDQWQRYEFPGEGFIAGKRNCSDGYSTLEYEGDGSYWAYNRTKSHSFWLVAYSLVGCRYVAEEDLELAGGEESTSCTDDPEQYDLDDSEIVALRELLKAAMNEGYARHAEGCLGIWYKDSAGTDPYPCKCGYVEWLEKAKEVTDV